ncbi:MAG: TIM barrel protein [Candidatus Acidiferrales bacterium]
MKRAPIARREFAKLAAFGAATAAAFPPLRAAARLNVGIGTFSYHNLSIDDMIVQLNTLQIHEIEMSRGEFMLFSRPTDDLFRSTRSKLDVAGIRCVSYYAANFTDSQQIDSAIRFANILGATNITGDAPAPILAQLDRRLSRERLTFGLHNHFFKEKFAYESPEDVLNALDPLSTTMGATADTGHFASCGYDPAESIRKLALRLRLVHLKDVQAAGGEINVLLGQGIARIPAVMQELHLQNFAGLVAVEYEKEGPVDDDLRQEIAFARSLA